MDVNVFYKTVFEDTLGLDILGLESRFKELVELINRTTLLTFSDHIPCLYTTTVDPNDRRYVVSRERSHYGKEYYLNDETLERFNMPILDIVDANWADTVRSGYFGEVVAMHQYQDVMDILMGAEQTYQTTLIDTAIPFKPDYDYRGGNIVYFRNIPDNTMVELVIRTKFPNLVSIPDSYIESFKKLAIYDIKIKLWNELKYLEEVVTPAGNLNLKVNDWESAERDREDWLKEFRLKSMPDRLGWMYFTVL